MRRPTVETTPPATVRHVASDLIIAAVCWMGVSFSLGWYYTLTYYGRAGWPMPTPEPCAAILLYYFSVLNVDTEIQGIHWMLVFPCAGAAWVGCLLWTARRFGVATPRYHVLAIRLAVAALPLAIPGPLIAWLAGQTSSGFEVHRMVAVALRRGVVTPPGWLTPLYFGLGLVALAAQIYVYGHTLQVPRRRAWMHWPAAAVVLVLVCIVAASLVAYPLRYAFE